MKTPEEIKKGLFCCSYYDMSCSECPYDGICRTAGGQTPEDDAAALIDHLLTSYSQVSKDLCGKENADLEELLQAVSQVKNRLAHAEQERDAAVEDLTITKCCKTCKSYVGAYVPNICMDCIECCNFEWRGICAENTKED